MRLRAQLLAALCASALQNITTVRSRHTLAEPMNLAALSLFGLIGTYHILHLFLPNIVMAHSAKLTFPIIEEAPFKCQGFFCDSKRYRFMRFFRHKKSHPGTHRNDLFYIQVLVCISTCGFKSRLAHQQKFRICSLFEYFRNFSYYLRFFEYCSSNGVLTRFTKWVITIVVAYLYVDIT